MTGDAAALPKPVVPPFDDKHCTLYDVIGLPLSAAATNETSALVDVAGTADTPVGRSGTPAGSSKAAVSAEKLPAPTALVARTRQR